MKSKDWIINWFESNTNATKEEIKNGMSNNYFEKGWIDSLQFISLITDLENNFKINFSNEEFQNRTFSTIDGLSILIEGKINE